MKNINLLILSIFSIAYAEAGSVSINGNSASVGKIIIDGQDMTDSGSVLKGTGVKKTINRNVGAFNSIISRGSFDIHFRQGEQEVSITGDSNIIEQVVTEVSGNTLMLHINKSFSTRLPIEINIASPDIEAIQLSGSSDVTLSNIDTPQLELDLKGSIDLEGNGKVDVLDIRMKGASDMNIKSLIAETVNIEVRGSGDVELFANQVLNARLSGSADIVYFGHPATLNKKISGSGDIEAGDD